MPQPRYLPPQQDLIGESLYKIASGAGEVMNQRLLQQQEDDAVKRLLAKYKPGMDRTDFLRESLSTGGLPLDKRAAIFEALSSAEKEQKVSKEQEKAKSLQEEAAIQAGNKYGIPPALAKTLGPKEWASIIKEQAKSAPVDPQTAKAIQDFNANPLVQQMSDLEYRSAAQIQGLPPKEIDKNVEIRQKAREISLAAELNPGQRMQYFMPIVNKINDDAEAAKKRLGAGEQFKVLFATGKVGPQNVRNFFAKLLPEDSPLGNLIRNPEDRFADTLSYQYLIGGKQDFGIRLSDADVRILQNKIISSADTPASAELKLKFFEAQDQLTITKQQIAREILDENNGIPPANFESQLSKRLKQQTEVSNNYEKAARDVMALDDQGASEGIWMVDPETQERHLINNSDVSTAEKEYGFRRL